MGFWMVGLPDADRRVESLMETIQNEDRVEAEHDRYWGDDPLDER